ncbi:hypothetical protein [Microbacterium sp. SSM24]|nr:hypothetical protein [Microbacterium sp. SSM24]MCW3493603.1 hypothetical protein [Microbacterium sp. SSM24]
MDQSLSSWVNLVVVAAVALVFIALATWAVLAIAQASRRRRGR